MGVISQIQLEIKTRRSDLPRRAMCCVTISIAHSLQNAHGSGFYRQTNRRSRAPGICETSKNPKNQSIFVCRERNLCSSSFSAPPPCCLIVSCLQNRDANNLSGTEAENRTPRFTGTGGKQDLPLRSKRAGRALTKVPWPLLANTEAFLLQQTLLNLLPAGGMSALASDCIFHLASDRCAPGTSRQRMLQTQRQL